MVRKSIVSISVAAAVLCSAAASGAQTSRRVAAPAVTTEDVDALKSQLRALQDRLAQLEQAQAAQAGQVAEATKIVAEQQKSTAEQQESLDRAIDNLAQTRANVGEWVGRFTWKGDLRYRNENIEQEFTRADRNRDRIRARFGFVAKVNDTVRTEIQLTTTENNDARSPNQTLTDANSRKPVGLDTAYAEWAPNASWKLTLGKMRYPWVRTSSYFYDGDINPEGVAVNYQKGVTGLFASAFVTRLAERNTSPNFADSNMFGAQVGWRGTFGDGGRYTLAAGYFDHGGVEGYNVIQSGGAGGFFGNSTTTSTAICRASISPCLANDFNIAEVIGEMQFNLAGRPLTLFADLARNSAADYRLVSANPTQNIPSGLDSAYAAGFTYGRASNPGTWEFGYIYQKVEKDALFGQWVDSDFAAGNTDGDGSAIRFAYAFAKNWRLNATYMINKTNNDVAAAVTFPTAQNVFDRDYKRLQLDLNMTF
ncbi:MAG: putative porin [Steroidobacteraceae bacterium]